LLRTSERGTFKRCRWKWWLEYEARIKGRATPALRFGSLIHKSLASYYKPGIRRGPNPVHTFEKLYQAELIANEPFGVTEDEKWIDAGELGPAMLQNYLNRYGKDEEWEVLVTEYPFRQLVRHPLTNDPWFWYVGILDGVWRYRPTKRSSIVDHKTATAIVPNYLALDDQATSYWTWGLDALYENKLLSRREKPGGMLYNFLRKSAPDDRPVNEHGEKLNKDGAVSKNQPSPYFARIPIYRDWNERESARTRSWFEFADMETIREGREGIEPPPEAYKNPGQFTCPGCWAFDICELHEIGQDWPEMLEMTTKPWDPYSEHEVYVSETR
jgi:hypothetical protein